MNAEEEELRHQMAALRGSLGNDLEHTVAGLREMVDWRQLVRHHPWACLGAAAIAGFAVIPSKATFVVKADASSISNLARGQGLHVEGASPGSGAVGTIARMVGQMAVRAATAYVTRRISASLAGAGIHGERNETL
jgi:hypothetical protein